MSYIINNVLYKHMKAVVYKDTGMLSLEFMKRSLDDEPDLTISADIKPYKKKKWITKFNIPGRDTEFKGVIAKTTSYGGYILYIFPQYGKEALFYNGGVNLSFKRKNPESTDDIFNSAI